MEKENKRKLIMIISLIFVALVLVGNVYALIDLAISNEFATIKKGGFIFVDSFTCIALIGSILYISAGFKKTSAKYFKFFLYAFILSELLTFFVEIIIIQNAILRIISVFIAFALLNVLFGSKDLGKKTSLILSTIILACSIFTMIYTLFTIPNINMRGVFWNLASVTLSIVLIVMMILKYYDKSLRNTK